MFRNARSLTGTQSTMINFSVCDFLHRTEKITALNHIKTTQIQNKDFKISFPRHPKHGKKEDSSRTTLNMDDIDDIDIDEIISKAFAHAKQLMSGLEIDIVLQKNKLLTLERLSQDVFNSLSSSSRVSNFTTSDSFPLEDSDQEDDSDTEETNNDDDDKNVTSNSSSDNEDEVENESLTTIGNEFSGMRIVNEIKPNQQDSYFQVKINDSVKYLHKQTACWLLTHKNSRLSTDRLSRVIQTGRKD
ncbi:unnamed protein product [Didymodactylos carnosus]|uniref:Uncharacterized protein n=1 Tax=Didymodactylos carnosus TaxID=1234261 RepID=A0A8S2RVY7_9BILA|nr:unnamed protein product [Didymodactylos carnosus]CAF4182215.1 unnamed protein product [Didymodactylos carnosus]